MMYVFLSKLKKASNMLFFNIYCFFWYESIKLNRYIQISKGDEFKITFTGMAPWAESLRIHTREGLSFSSSGDEK